MPGSQCGRDLDSENMWLPKLWHSTLWRRRGRRKRTEKGNGQGGGGIRRRIEGSKGERGWAFVSFSTQCKKKDKEKGQRSRGWNYAWQFREKFSKTQVRKSALVAGLAVWSSPRTASSPATSLSLATICMASNERVLMLVSQGWVMALHTGLGAQVQALALWKELRGAADCPPGPTVH